MHYPSHDKNDFALIYIAALYIEPMGIQAADTDRCRSHGPGLQWLLRVSSKLLLLNLMLGPHGSSFGMRNETMER
jgi:hypothetical protein